MTVSYFTELQGFIAYSLPCNNLPIKVYLLYVRVYMEIQWMPKVIVRHILNVYLAMYVST